MGKRNFGKFDLKPKDYYPTIDPEAIPETFLQEVRGVKYAEPCYGRGDLEKLLMEVAECKWRSDVDPQVESAVERDACDLTHHDLSDCGVIITNPPYSWNALEPLLTHLPSLLPTWFLLPADMAHNKRMGPYMRMCQKIISVGRLYWMVDRPVRGVENFAWYLFTSCETDYTRFVGR